MLPLPEDTQELLRIDTRFNTGLSWKKKPSKYSPIKIGGRAGYYCGENHTYFVVIRGEKFDAQRIRMYLRNHVDPGDIDTRRRTQVIPQAVIDSLPAF